METHTRPALRGQRVPPREDPQRGQRRTARRRLPEQSGLTLTHTSDNGTRTASPLTTVGSRCAEGAAVLTRGLDTVQTGRAGAVRPLERCDDQLATTNCADLAA